MMDLKNHTERLYSSLKLVLQKKNLKNGYAMYALMFLCYFIITC